MTPCGTKTFILTRLVHRKVQGLDGPLQRSLKVNSDQVAAMSPDMDLHERPYVTLNQLFAESGIVTPHCTRLIS